MTERWLPIAGFEDRYEVSDRGRVKSLARWTHRLNRWGSVNRWWMKEKILASVRALATGKYRTGALAYSRVGLVDSEAKTTQYSVHRLVLSAFIGPCPTGYEGAHEDGDTANNTLINLSWKTSKENSADRIRHGTQTHKPSWRKLTFADAQRIRQAVSEGATQASQASTYGLHSSYVCQLINRSGRYTKGLRP